MIVGQGKIIIEIGHAICEREIQAGLINHSAERRKIG
jgi:hypothetical protein